MPHDNGAWIVDSSYHNKYIIVNVNSPILKFPKEFVFSYIILLVLAESVIHLSIFIFNININTLNQSLMKKANPISFQFFSSLLFGHPCISKGNKSDKKNLCYTIARIPKNTGNIRCPNLVYFIKYRVRTRYIVFCFFGEGVYTGD